MEITSSGLTSVLGLGGAASTGQGCTGDRVGTPLPAPHSLSHAGLVGGKVKIQKRQILPLGDINVSLPKSEDWKGEIELPAVPRGQKRQLAVLIKPG